MALLKKIKIYVSTSEMSLTNNHCVLKTRSLWNLNLDGFPHDLDGNKARFFFLGVPRPIPEIFSTSTYSTVEINFHLFSFRFKKDITGSILQYSFQRQSFAPFWYFGFLGHSTTPQRILFRNQSTAGLIFLQDISGSFPFTDLFYQKN